MFVNFVLFCEERNVGCGMEQTENVEWRPTRGGGGMKWKHETKTSQA